MTNRPKLDWLPVLMFALLIPGSPVAAQDSGSPKLLHDQLEPLLAKHEVMTRELGPQHPNVVALEKQIRSVETLIKTLNFHSGVKKGDEMRETLTQLVSQVFDLQLQIHAERIDRAEMELEKAKRALAERRKVSKQLIDRKVESLLAGLKEESNATKVAPKSSKIEGGTSTTLAMKGWAVWRQQDFAKAKEYFVASLEQDPENTNALNGLGWSHLHTAKFDDAVELFEKALALEPEHGGASNGLGQALMAQGKTAEAKRKFLEAVDKLIKKYGEKRAVQLKATPAWIGLVRVLISRGELEEAQQWVDRYRRHDSKDQIINGMQQEIEAAVERSDAEL